MTQVFSSGHSLFTVQPIGIGGGVGTMAGGVVGGSLGLTVGSNATGGGVVEIGP